MKYLILLLPFAILMGCNGSDQKPVEQGLHPDTAQKAFLAVTSDILTARREKGEFPSFNQDPRFAPPAGADVFQLSQDFPKDFDTEEYPWLSVDFRTDPNGYSWAVLNYCLEGNREVDFRGQDNETRKWYHAPWLHYGTNGREYWHGLTRERQTPNFEIARTQSKKLENWAVGMYNAPGGKALGDVWNSVWSDRNLPSPENAVFPEGTATFKLLFTAGTIDQVPFLEKTFVWTGNVYPDSVERDKRVDMPMHLIQIDIATRDNRSPVGWVFGTFIYDAAKAGETPWDRLVSVGLAWGDDENVTKELNKDGAFINPDLAQTYLQESLVEDPDKEYTDQAYMRYHGLGGRLNGPVDNPISSCISCHSQAATYKNYYPLNDESGNPMPMANFGLTRAIFTVEEFQTYFSNVEGGAYTRNFQGEDYLTVDYSLQLSAGINKFYQALRDQAAEAPEMADIKNYADSNAKIIELQEWLNEDLPEVDRGE